jgi:hypothetical protein
MGDLANSIAISSLTEDWYADLLFRYCL